MGSAAQEVKKYSEYNFAVGGIMLQKPMRMIPDRAVLTVQCLEGVWAVELDGELFGQSPDQNVARAAANRRVREMQDAGRACQVRIKGEPGFFVAP